MEFSLSEVETLAEAFGITPGELLGYTQNSGPPPGIRATGGGMRFVDYWGAPALGLEPRTCRLTLAPPPDQWRRPPALLPDAEPEAA
jgi:hypothetical protein